MFDEFLDELRRRQAEAASGQPPRPVPDPQDDPVADDDSATLDDDEAALDPESTVDEDESDVEPEPITIGGGGRGGQGGGRGGPPRGPRRGRSVGGPNDGAGFSLRRQISVAIAVVVVFFVIIMVAVGLELWTDAIWYASVGYDAVFWTRLGAQVGLFVGGLVLALVVLLGNLWLAGRLAPPAEGAGAGGTVRGWLDRLNEAILESEQRSGRARESLGRRPGDGTRGPVNVTPYELPNATPIGRVVIAIVAVFVALTVGGALASNWATVLLWINRVPFDPAGAGTVTDPVFGRDIAFFMFDLGFLRFVQVTVIGLVIASLLVAGARYLVAALDGSAIFSTPVRVHLGVLAGLFLLAIAVGYQFDKFELVYSSRMPGLATGVSYTDENAQFLAYDVLTGLSALAAAFLVGGAFSRVLWPLGLTVAVWFIASIGIGRIYPEVVQRVTVTPNARVLEAPYIQNNIAMTRLAFDLGGWDVRDYRGEAPLSEAAITEHQATFLNARLWDYRPLGDTLDQLQTVRQYYDFTDVDTDRYRLGDDTRQVMLSVRELDLAKNPSATGWVNQRVTYTHGIGVAMVPVNEVATQGQPRLIIRDLPPVSSQGAPAITEPRVYFGERESSYVVVGAQQDEFDYPVGGSDDIKQTTRWTGQTGIRLDTTLARLLYALRFRDFDLLISPQVTNDSQLLFHRSLSDRLPRIAPFLLYDKDPYVVVRDDGRLVYVQDAYTATNRFPHGQGFNPSDLNTPGVAPTGLGERSFNYLRNSVKIVVDAYDGTMTFYANDPDDALIRAWQGVFPTLFQPMSDFPTDLRPHLRVPEEQFNVQTRVYGRYHVQNADTFYDSADLWTVPISQTSESSLPSEAYYVIMSLPEAVDPEFLLLQPMIPKDRPNMIAWVAARNDVENYGQTLVYRFPTETSVFGPAQIEASIDADPEISAQFTLWSQSGSSVIRGNLIVVPVGDSLIYLQPVYLQATSSKFPAFQKIIVASPTTVVWGDTLRQALNQLLRDQGGGPGPSPTPSPPGPTPSPGPTQTPAPGSSPPSGDVAALVDYANLHFELAQQALRDGDFARYGQEIELVEEALGQLEELVGGSSPGPSATPSAAP